MPEDAPLTEHELPLGWRRDLRSKLLDGLLPALVLYLLLMLVVFGLAPIVRLFGGPGLFLYMVGLLGIAMFSLQHALLLRLPETTRAWYGMAGGVLAWAVTEISGLLAGGKEATLREMIGLIMAWLVIALLWRGNLSLGARFFVTAYLTNWSGSVLLSTLQTIASWNPVLELFFRSLGVISAAGSLLLLIWMFFRSERRIQRIWASLFIVLLGAGAVFVFQGKLF
jgi:hypothetical protein